MSLGRTFWKLTRYARAARFWLLLALAALAWLASAESAAANREWSCPSGSPCTREVALANCQETMAHFAEMYNPPRYSDYRCVVLTNPQAYRMDSWGGGWNSGSGGRVFYFRPCEAGTVWNDLPGQQRCMTTCSSRGTPTFTPASGAMIPNGSVGCSDGCEYMTSSNGDGTYSRFFIGDTAINHCSTIPNQCTNNGPGYVMNYGLGMCVPPMPECAPNEIKDPLTGMCTQGCPAGMVTDATGMCVPQADTCPAGHVRSPSGECLPGQGQCAAGEARKPDGTCGPDSDNDGEPDATDPDEPSSFSGGDNCNAPPSCSGDAIQCGIARISWRIDCNTRKDTTVSGGSCGAIPVCTGKNCDALEYSQLLQQWRSTCALEKLAQDGIGGGDDDDGPQSCGPGKSDAECEAGQNIGDEGDPASGMVETEYLASGFDASGYGWAQSCPSIPAVTVFGHTLDFQSKLGPLCEWFQLGGIFLMIATGITCLTLLIKV